jgi:RHS repeat-associated protein
MGSYTAKERDAESGNDYFNARYYGSTMGRFMSPDPSGEYYANPANPQTWNMYGYVANNPLVNIDPYGLWIWNLGNCYFHTFSYSVNGHLQGYQTEPAGCFSQSSQQIQPQQQKQEQPKQPPKIDCSSPPSKPPMPKDASIEANEQATKQHGAGWWLLQVRPGGNWDYKKGGNEQYAAFGNVNYGATCNALGHTMEFCQRGAGAAAYGTAIANKAAGGGWTAGPGNPIGSPVDDEGMPDYGDQATGTENQAVIAGFAYAQWQKACHK